MEDKRTPMPMSYLSQNHLTLELIWDNKQELYSLTCYQPVFIRDGTLSSTQLLLGIVHCVPSLSYNGSPLKYRMLSTSFQALSECILYPAISGSVLEWNGWKCMGPGYTGHRSFTSPLVFTVTADNQRAQVCRR